MMDAQILVCLSPNIVVHRQAVLARVVQISDQFGAWRHARPAIHDNHASKAARFHILDLERFGQIIVALEDDDAQSPAEQPSPLAPFDVLLERTGFGHHLIEFANLFWRHITEQRRKRLQLVLGLYVHHLPDDPRAAIHEHELLVVQRDAEGDVSTGVDRA